MEGVIRVHRDLGGVPADDFPARYTALIEEQNYLGWDQMYRGRWSRHWRYCHEEYSRDRWTWDSSEKQGLAWLFGVGKILFDQWK